MPRLDVKVWREEEEYAVSVGDDAPTFFQVPQVWEKKLENIRTWSGKVLEGFGEEAFGWLFSPPGRLFRLEKLIKEASEKDPLVLRIVSEEPEIHNLPWELLYHPKFSFLLRSGRVNLFRHDPRADKLPEPVEGPVKILMIIALPLKVYEEHPLDLLTGLKGIYEELEEFIGEGKIEFDVEERATFSALARRLKDNAYHVIHYTGHALAGGKLLMEDEEDPYKERLIPAKEWLQLFLNQPVRLFILDACETAKSRGAGFLTQESLAQYLYRAFPGALVIANTFSVYDHLATKSMKILYRDLFRDPVRRFLIPVRRQLPQDWWKTVIFGEDLSSPLFTVGKGPRSPQKRVTLLPTTEPTFYVYRWGLVRQASNYLERDQYMVLHGPGGSGKSTLARFLSEFWGGKFRHRLFVDLREEELDTPEKVLDFLWAELEEREIPLGERPPRLRPAVKLLREKLPGEVLLVLDNLEGYAQELEGPFKKPWLKFIEILLECGFYLVLTSRVKPWRNNRTPFQNILQVGEYTPWEYFFFIRRLEENQEKEKALYLVKYHPFIERYFGRHPLSLSLLIEHRPSDPKRMVLKKEFKEYLGFYEEYLKGEEACWLWLIDEPVREEFLEALLSPDHYFLLKDKLALFRQTIKGLELLPVLRTYLQVRLPFPEGTPSSLEAQLREDLIPKDPRAHLRLHLRLYAHGLLSEEGQKKLQTVLVGLEPHRFGYLFSPEDLPLLRRIVEYWSASSPEELNNRGIAKQRLGEVHLRAGEVEEAKKCFRQAIHDYDQVLNINPGHLYALNNRGTAKQSLGEVHLRAGEMEEAKKCFRQAIQDYDQVSRRFEGTPRAFAYRLLILELGLKAGLSRAELRPYMEEFLREWKWAVDEARHQAVHHLALQNFLEATRIEAEDLDPGLRIRFEEFKRLYQQVKRALSPELP